jgi:hypothetical protein
VHNPDYIPVDNIRKINYTGGYIGLQTEARYNLSLWIQTIGNVSDIQWHIYGLQGDRTDPSAFSPQSFIGSISSSSTWNKVGDSFQIDSKYDNQKNANLVNVRFILSWLGDGTLYLDDFRLAKAE